MTAGCTGNGRSLRSELGHRTPGPRALQPNTGTRGFHEPVRLGRNVAIALLVGGALVLRVSDLGRLLPFSALALWFSLGGHYVEVAFLNGVRPRIPSAWLTQAS